MTELNNFVNEKRKSNGGWAEITDSDVDELSDIIHELIKAKCQPDADGDYPINLILINRRKYEYQFFFPLEYLHKLETKEEIDGYINKASLNVKMAMDRLRNALESRREIK